MVTCVYVNPQQDRFWLIDYRIYDPQGDGKTKWDHLKDMLSAWVYQKGLPFTGVLVDSLTWTQAERKQGKLIKIRGVPKDHKVK